MPLTAPPVPHRPAMLNRRRALALIGLTAAGGVMMPKTVFAQGNSTSMLIADSDVCAITPEVTEGPYYFDPELVRTDITEGRPGVPMRMRIQVVDATCQPLEGARVDIWHCGADGLYSNYSGQGDNRQTSTVGETFFRGTQFADASGIVGFDTVYPGWYSGRTTHIHFKVFLDETNVLTGQIFFPDALSEFIYENAEAYGGRTNSRDTFNEGDNIAAQATRASYAQIKEEDDYYLASLIVGVNPSATSSGFSMGGNGQGNAPGNAPGNGERPSGPPPSGGNGGPGAQTSGSFSLSDLFPGSDS